MMQFGIVATDVSNSTVYPIAAIASRTNPDI